MWSCFDYAGIEETRPEPISACVKTLLPVCFRASIDMKLESVDRDHTTRDTII
jgi:hypothetical protein